MSDEDQGSNVKLMKDALQLAFNDGAFPCPLYGREKPENHTWACLACQVRGWLTPGWYLREGAEAPTANNHQALVEALRTLLDRYVAMVNSGDCGKWDPETEAHVIAARAALKLAEQP